MTGALTCEDAPIGCDGKPDTAGLGFLSPNLLSTRDNFRQMVIDHLNLIDALKNDAVFDFINSDELSFLGGRSRSVESVEVGGATVFELPVLRFEGLAAPEPADQPTLPNIETVGATHMLVAAIVHAANAGNCLQALLHAGYRVTRIKTVGGFLRRGNTTLLTGVAPDQVDHAIGLLRQACRQNTADETPGIVFVLPVSPFLQV